MPTDTILKQRALAARQTAERTALFWVLGFIGVQFACQVALLFEALSPARVVFRTSAFAFSLLALVLVPGVARPHPARWPLLIGLGAMLMNLFHPEAGTPLSGLAQIGLAIAVMAPLFWASRLVVTRRVFGTVVGFIWSFSLASSAVGMLQVFYPGQFDFAVSKVIEESRHGAAQYAIVLADGTEMLRPSGLTDVPSGAATAGLTAILLAFGHVAANRSWLVRGLSAAAVVLGVFVMFFAQVRVVMVIGAVAYVTLLGLLLYARRPGAAGLLAAGVPVAFLIAFSGAAVIGGDRIIGRFETLVNESPDEVYAKNRGGFLNDTIYEYAPSYPFGAGLGRHGMMHQYFGDKDDYQFETLWVEIQWTAWVFDGGLILVFSYAAAIALTFLATLRVVRDAQEPWLRGWAALVCAYDMMTAALTFSYAPFLGQLGMEFWLLNGLIWAAARPAHRPILRQSST